MRGPATHPMHHADTEPLADASGLHAETIGRPRPVASRPMRRAAMAVGALSIAAAGCSSAVEPEAAPATTEAMVFVDDGAEVVAIPVRQDEPAALTIDQTVMLQLPITEPAGSTADGQDAGQGTGVPASDDTSGGGIVLPTTTDGGSGTDTSPAGGGAGTPTGTVGSGSGSATGGATGPVVRPPWMVVVRGGETVLLTDTETGEAWTVTLFDAVVDPEDQIGPQAPRSVDADTLNAAVWVDECCRPADGTSHRYDVTTAQRLHTVAAGHPTADPTRGRVITTNGASVELRNADGAIVSALDLADRLGRDVAAGRSAIDATGTRLAVEATLGDEPTIVVMSLDGDSIELLSTFSAPDDTRWSSPTFGADGLLRIVESSDRHGLRILDSTTGETVRTTTLPLPGIVDADVDASGTWWLLVDGAGAVHSWDGTELRSLPGDGISAASW